MTVPAPKVGVVTFGRQRRFKCPCTRYLPSGTDGEVVVCPCGKGWMRTPDTYEYVGEDSRDG